MVWCLYCAWHFNWCSCHIETRRTRIRRWKGNANTWLELISTASRLDSRPYSHLMRRHLSSTTPPVTGTTPRMAVYAVAAERNQRRHACSSCCERAAMLERWKTAKCAPSITICYGGCPAAFAQSCARGAAAGQQLRRVAKAVYFGRRRRKFHRS